ncbi:MAG: MFS transporter [Planctomycetaceae bacterium]|jgi:MFS family permease|nr:MFS transporter [Planctomycetaceae bacterium]
MDDKVKLFTKEYIITTCINFCTAINFYLLMIIISDYAMKQFAAPSSQAGLAASVFVIGALIARLFVGKWMARVGYKQMLLIGVAAGFVMTIPYFFVNNILQLIVVRFLHGATFGIVSTAAATIIADIVPKGKRGKGIGYYSLSQTLATAIGPFLGLFLVQRGGYTGIFVVCTAASVISLVLVPFLSLPKIELTDKQMKSLQGFRLSNFIEYKVVAISFIALLLYVCYSSIVSFLAVYAKEIKLEEAAGFFFVVYAVVVLFSRPAVGKLFDKRGEHPIMYVSIIMFSAGIYLFSTSYSNVMLLLAAALIGLGMGAIQLSTQTIAVQLAPQHRMGLANSTYFMLSDIGMGIGPLLVGFLIPYSGYRGMYTIVSLVALACVLFYFMLHHKRTKKNEL